MFHTNLSFVPAVTFAVTPTTPNQEFQNLVDMLANNRRIDVRPDGSPVGTTPVNPQVVKPTNLTPSSSLGQGNMRVVTSDSSEFAAGDGLPFSTPVVPSNAPDNVTYTSDQLIHVGTPGTTSNKPPASSINGGTNLVQTTSGTETFAARWYESNTMLTNSVTGESLGLTGKQLYDAEVKAMMESFPSAKLGTMQTTGELYWVFPAQFRVGAEVKTWTFMLKYDNNHPHHRDFGGSVKAIPMLPSLDELERRAAAAGVSIHGNVSKLSHVPHVWKDNVDNMLYLCTIGTSVQKSRMSDNYIQSAASVAARAVRWALYYEVGLKDANVWRQFCKG